MSLAKARDVVRQLKQGQDRDIVTLIRGGTYAFGDTVVVGLQDSAENGFPMYVLLHFLTNSICIMRPTDLVDWTDERLFTHARRQWPWAQGRITAGQLSYACG